MIIQMFSFSKATSFMTFKVLISVWPELKFWRPQVSSKGCWVLNCKPYIPKAQHLKVESWFFWWPNRKVNCQRRSWWLEYPLAALKRPTAEYLKSVERPYFRVGWPFFTFFLLHKQILLFYHWKRSKRVSTIRWLEYFIAAL